MVCCTPAKRGSILANVMVYTGEADPMVPAEQVEAFRKEMELAGVQHTIVSYPGAQHAFTNPEATAKGEKYGIPLKYDELADQVSWGHMQMVFREVFGA